MSFGGGGGAVDGAHLALLKQLLNPKPYILNPKPSTAHLRQAKKLQDKAGTSSAVRAFPRT